jgi:hypothetical protein
MAGRGFRQTRDRLLAEIDGALESGRSTFTIHFTQVDLGRVNLDYAIGLMVDAIQAAGHSVAYVGRPAGALEVFLTVSAAHPATARDAPSRAAVGTQDLDTPRLTDESVQLLLRKATEHLDYQSVLALHEIYAPAAPPDALWDWWLDEADELAQAGEAAAASLALDFAMKANIPPWAGLNEGHYNRIRSIRGSIETA